MHQQARTRALLQPAALQIPRHLRELDELVGGGLVDAGFVHQDLGFQFCRRVVELEGDEALAG